MFPEFDLDRPGPPSGGPLSKEQQAFLDEMLRRTLDPEEHRRLERLLLQRLKERQPELTGMLQEEGFVTGFQENEGHRFGVAGQRSRQRLDCACLQHRFPFAATRQALSQARRCPAAKAPVKPDALQTLARAINRFPDRPVRLHPFSPEFREVPGMSDSWTHPDRSHRYYHTSSKVYRALETTEKAVRVLHDLLPERKLNLAFERIIRQGTGKDFELEHNREWDRHTRPMLEAFAHAKFMVEMAVRYADLPEPPQPMPNGWATLLYLFDLR